VTTQHRLSFKNCDLMLLLIEQVSGSHTARTTTDDRDFHS
jgi:hypothetical protein